MIKKPCYDLFDEKRGYKLSDCEGECSWLNRGDSWWTCSSGAKSVYMKNHALESTRWRREEVLSLRQRGLTRDAIGQLLGVTRERVRQIEHQAQWHIDRVGVDKEENVLIRTLYGIEDPHISRVVNSLINYDDTDHVSIAKKGAGELSRVKNLGVKGIALIAQALEKIGTIPNATEWLRGVKWPKDGEACPLCGNRR